MTAVGHVEKGWPVTQAAACQPRGGIAGKKRPRKSRPTTLRRGRFTLISRLRSSLPLRHRTKSSRRVRSIVRVPLRCVTILSKCFLTGRL
jgi:hypothetical protein